MTEKSLGEHCAIEDTHALRIGRYIITWAHIETLIMFTLACLAEVDAGTATALLYDMGTKERLDRLKTFTKQNCSNENSTLNIELYEPFERIFSRLEAANKVRNILAHRNWQQQSNSTICTIHLNFKKKSMAAEVICYTDKQLEDQLMQLHILTNDFVVLYTKKFEINYTSSFAPDEP